MLNSLALGPCLGLDSDKQADTKTPCQAMCSIPESKEMEGHIGSGGQGRRLLRHRRPSGPISVPDQQIVIKSSWL
jgi:hypothetical protein